MKIYTKTGDKATTSLYGGTRLPKHHNRVNAYGTVDELNAWVGLLGDLDIDTHSKDILTKIQSNLFTLGAMLATDPEKAILKNGKERLSIPTISNEDITLIEIEIDKMNENLDPMTHFILAGGHQTVSTCHITRTICRKAERKISLLHENEPVEQTILAYINRLSDYFFVLARKLSKNLKVKETKWIPKK